MAEDLKKMYRTIMDDQFPPNMEISFVDEKGRPKKVTFVLDMTEKLEALAKLEQIKKEASAVRDKLRSIAENARDSSPESFTDELRAISEEVSNFIA